MANNDMHNAQLLPDGWVWTNVGEIYDVVGGGTPSTQVSEYWDGNIPWITSADIHGLRDIRPRKQVAQAGIESSATNLVPKDSLIVVTRVGLGKVALAETPLCFSQDSQALIDHTDSLYPDYSLYYLSQAVQTFRHKSRGTTISGVTKKQLRELPFPLAPLPEQRRIVAEIETQFTRLDAAVAALERAQATLQRYKASVLKAACEGRLVPTEMELYRKGAVTAPPQPAGVLLQRILAERHQRWEEDQWQKELAKARKKAAQAKRKAAGLPARIRDLAYDEWQRLPQAEYDRYLPKDDKWKRKYKEPAPPDTEDLPELPEGWVWGTVNQLAAHEPNSITDGPFGSKLKTVHYTETGPRVIRLQNIGNGEFHDEKAHISEEHFETLRKHEVFAGDLVIAALGESLPRSCIIPSFVGPAIVKADCMRFKPHSGIGDTKYMNAALNSEPLKRIAASVVHGVGRPRLNQQEIKSLLVPIPPIQEQHRIVAEVERRISVVAALEAAVAANLRRAEWLRQSILKRAFEGRLVPQDLNDEPASVLLERIQVEKAQRKPQGKGKKKSRQLELL